jgi:hypothetical protein
MKNLCCWAVLGIVSLSILAGVAGECRRWLAPAPGSFQEAFCNIQVGMTQDQVVAVLRAYDYKICSVCLEGTSRDGQPFILSGSYSDTYHTYDRLPPPQHIGRCMIGVEDEYDQEMKVLLGPGGAVVEKSLTPSMLEGQSETVLRAITEAITGTPKLLRSSSVRRRPWGYIACAVVVLLLAWWGLRRWARSGRPGQPHADTNGSAALPGTLPATGRSSSNS